MSDFEKEQIAIFEYVKASWETSMGAIDYQNLRNPKVAAGSLLTQVTIVHNDAARQRESMGGLKFFISPGFVNFVVHSPEESGTLKQSAVLDKIVEFMDEKILYLDSGHPIKFGVAGILTLGIRDGTYRRVVSVPFHRLEW